MHHMPYVMRCRERGSLHQLTAADSHHQLCWFVTQTQVFRHNSQFVARSARTALDNSQDRSFAALSRSPIRQRDRSRLDTAIHMKQPGAVLPPDAEHCALHVVAATAGAQGANSSCKIRLKELTSATVCFRCERLCCLLHATGAAVRRAAPWKELRAEMRPEHPWRHMTPFMVLSPAAADCAADQAKERQ